MELKKANRGIHLAINSNRYDGKKYNTISCKDHKEVKNEGAVAISKLALQNEFEEPLEDLDETQKKIKDALTKAGLNEKLENYLLVEKEKKNRREYVLGYPYWCTVDPANFCNLKCPFCPTGQMRGSRAKGILSLPCFEKIIGELGTYLIHIDFCNWGEPLLNSDIYEMVKRAKQYSIDTKIDSNLNRFSEKDAEDMILSGLDKLIVSIDGATPGTYSKYRVGGDFNGVVDNLMMLVKKKRELKKSNPYICWQFLVFRHNEHEIEQVKKMARDCGVDNIGITKAFIGDKDWIPLNEEYSRYRREEIKDNSSHTSDFFKSSQGKFCSWPWEAIAINPNGSVSPCCSVEDEKDDFGNIFDTSFKEVWNNEKYRLARRYISDKRTIQGRGDNICINCQQLGLINLDILSCHSFFNA